MGYLYTKEFYLAIKKNEILSFPWKWIELGNIILNEVSQAQKNKGPIFFLICGIWTQYKYKQYYEKQVTPKEGHIWKKECKEKKLRRWIWLMYFLYKNDYRTFKYV
jgi:hypothetical protein